jgi:hypothetical protein
MAFYKLGTREGGVNPTGNAVEANVLKDKTFSNASGINKIGTMPDNSTTTSNGNVPGINSSYPNIPIRPGSNLQMGVNTDGVKQLAIEPPQGYYPGGGSSYIGVDADDLGDAVASDVVSGKTFTSESGIEVVGTMPNNGAVSPSALSPNGSYTIPLGYHNGNGVVTASPNTGTYSPTTRNAALDMGISNLNRYVNTTGIPNSNTETYTASSRNAALDMGATNSYRYVNTNGVPNSNSGTYTFPANDKGGTKDLGETNTYRYVNATNVYNKGKADGSSSSNEFIIRGTSPSSSCGVILQSSFLKGYSKVTPYIKKGGGTIKLWNADNYITETYSLIANLSNNTSYSLSSLTGTHLYLFEVILSSNPTIVQFVLS